MGPIVKGIKDTAIEVLRWSEGYTKTDMVYLAKTGWWVNLNFIITSTLALFLSIAFANLLSPEIYGIYQYLLSLSALIGAITLGGMSGAVTQAVSRGYEGALRDGMKAQLQWSIIPTIVSVGISCYYFLHGNSTIGWGLICIAILTPFIGAVSTYSAYLNGKREFRTGFYFSLIPTTCYYISIALALLFLKNALLLLLINLGVNALATAYAYIRVLKIYKPNREVDPGTVPYGKHLSFMNAFGTILVQFDSILVFHFLGPIQLAIYTFASLLPERIAGFFGFIGTAMLPKLANRSHEEIKNNIISQVVRVAIVCVIGTVLYIVIAPPVFHLLFPRYINAILYTQIYAPIIVLLTILGLVNTTLVAKQQTRRLYIVNFVDITMREKVGVS